MRQLAQASMDDSTSQSSAKYAATSQSRSSFSGQDTLPNQIPKLPTGESLPHRHEQGRMFIQSCGCFS